MLRKYCLETGRGWDEGLPFLLFAVRDATQESLSFSPAELVFAHTPRGPLKALKEGLLASSLTKPDVLSYVNNFQARLCKANQVAREALGLSQDVMKKQYDKGACKMTLQVGLHD